MHIDESEYITNITAQNIRTGAKLLSYIFRPAYFPLLGFSILFLFTYLNLLPITFKLTVLAMVWFLTIGLPHLIIYTIRHLKDLTPHQIHLQHNRPIVYITNIICYLACLNLCHQIHLPMFMSAIMISSLLVQCICVIINFYHRISLHSAGTGLIIGTMMAYSFIFNFNPTWWLITTLILSGAVMTSRMILVHHTLGQVLGGTAIGIICGFLTVIIA